MPEFPPQLSVVIAARDAAATIGTCLEAACAQTGVDYEIIVVDDCSRDSTASIAERFRVTLMRMPRHRGVAAARNIGAGAARAPLLLFLDADVVAAPGLFALGATTMTTSQIDAVIGSYDDRPAADSIVSRFKNLAHHHFHQNANPDATTFWGACGFIRSVLFREVGGFDEARFVLPSIEDVELGARLVKLGAKMRIDPRLQVTHLKRWTLGNLLVVDVTRRAIPWTLLGLETGKFPVDLNFSWQQRLASAVAVAELASLAGLLFGLHSQWMVLGVLTIAAIILNLRLFRLFYEKGGTTLAIGGFLLQQLYYIYSLCGLSVGLIIYLFRRMHTPATSRP